MVPWAGLLIPNMELRMIYVTNTTYLVIFYYGLNQYAKSLMTEGTL